MRRESTAATKAVSRTDLVFHRSNGSGALQRRRFRFSVLFNTGPLNGFYPLFQNTSISKLETPSLWSPFSQQYLNLYFSEDAKVQRYDLTHWVPFLWFSGDYLKVKSLSAAPQACFPQRRLSCFLFSLQLRFQMCSKCKTVRMVTGQQGLGREMFDSWYCQISSPSVR